MQQIILRQGEGPEVKRDFFVEVNYKSRFLNGKEFDSSYPHSSVQFKVGNGEVIKGWEEGIIGLKVGSIAELTCKPEYAYGENGSGIVPPNQTCVFTLEIIDVWEQTDGESRDKKR